MRKIIALVIVLTSVVTLFTACKKNEEETTTQDPLYTAYTPNASGSSTTKATSDKTTENKGSTSATTTKKDSSVSPIGSTYVLTTSPDKKAPWYSTTRFVPGVASTAASQVSTTSNPYENVTYTTGTITPPVSASTSSAQTTTWQNITTTTTTAPSTTEAETTTEEDVAAEPEGMDVVINDVYIDGEGKLYASIDSDGWGSRIKSSSMRVPIYIDGIEAEKPATIQISSSTNGDGFQCVFVDISNYEIIDYGGTVSFTIPEGFLQNAAGTKFNYACEVSMQS